MAAEPIRKGHVVQLADVGHAALGVDERAHDGGGAQRQRVLDLVPRRQLRRREERLEACGAAQVMPVRCAMCCAAGMPS